MGPPQRYFVGLSLGQAQEFTALAVLARPPVRPDDPPAARRPGYALGHLRRFPPGTPYAEVADAVRGLLRSPPLPGAVLGVDRTGVGTAVVQLLAEGLRDRVTCLFCPVTVTLGHEVTFGEQGGPQVPRKELAGTLQVLLQSRRLQVARALPDAGMLVKELENFRVKVVAPKGDTFEAWREGPHDDLVLAVALGAWLGELALLALPRGLEA